jgi:hypothetical protein
VRQMPPPKDRLPRTTVGLWLRALLRGDSDGYRRLVAKLNRGEKGWNDDEPAVVEAACQIVVRQYFSTYKHVSVEVFVTDMRERMAKKTAPPRKEDIEAVIKYALNEGAGAPLQIRRGELHQIRGTVTANISDILRLDAKAVDDLVVGAESVALERGYSPPFVAVS